MASAGVPIDASRGCLLIASYPDHYTVLERNLRSMRRFATDAPPPVHIVLDTLVDASNAGHRFSRALGSTANVHSLQGLMRDVGEDASTDPGVRNVLEQARRDHCTGAPSAASHLCKGHLQSESFQAGCRKRCMTGRQPRLASLPALPASASNVERLKQIHTHKIAKDEARPSESECTADCKVIAGIAARYGEEMGTPADGLDRFDFFTPSNKAALADIGMPKRGWECAKPPFGYYNFKRKYQVLKKLYGSQHLHSLGCSLIWVIDSESFAFRRFAFTDIFTRYARRPTVFLGGPTSPTPSTCHLQTLLANWGAATEGQPMERLTRAIDLEPFHDDFWMWEANIINDMMIKMRAGGPSGSRRSIAGVLLNASEYGTHHEQVVYSNWILVQQQLHPDRYSHVHKLDVEKKASERWPALQLERFLLSLRSQMLGPTLARLHAAIALGLDAVNASALARQQVRSELIEFFVENDWLYVRGGSHRSWRPSPWSAVHDLMPEWPGAWCVNNCEIDDVEARKIGVPQLQR